MPFWLGFNWPTLEWLIDANTSFPVRMTKE
jgi:hypothetical protein